MDRFWAAWLGTLCFVLGATLVSAYSAWIDRARRYALRVIRDATDSARAAIAPNGAELPERTELDYTRWMEA